MPRDLPPSAVVVPRWIQVALGEIGVREDTRPGKSTPKIEQYHAVTRAGAALDDVPWCSSYVAWCVEMAGIASTKSRAAASWLTWGEACDEPYFGSVAVFDKHDPDAAGTGHVGFCLGVSGHEIFMLGGNQRDRVGVDVRDARKVVAYRWPAAVQMPSSPPKAVA